MATDHNGGNIQNAITIEEHDGALNAKRVSLVSSATIFVSTTVTLNPTLGSNATYGNISLTSVATQILPSDATRRSLIVQNISNSTVFIGTSNGVSSSNGIRLLTDDSLTLDQYDGSVFGIADATGHAVRFVAELD